MKAGKSRGAGNAADHPRQHEFVRVRGAREHNLKTPASRVTPWCPVRMMTGQTGYCNTCMPTACNWTV
jgi:hypothetical protein